MKRVLVFSLELQGYQEACQLEVGCEYIEKGDDVLFLTCGQKVGFCDDNRIGNKLQCFFCKQRQANRACKMVKGLRNIRSIDDYISPEIILQANNFKLEFKTVDEVKSVRYHDVEIGYGALSSYVSSTRNIDVDVTGESGLYLRDLMHMEIRMILAIERVIEDYRPELIVFHNGRYAHYKPFLDLSRKYNIDYLCTEVVTAADGTACRDFYYNGIPHNVINRDAQIRSVWNKNKDVGERERIAISFFENRRNALFAGDFIYAKNQRLGTLPPEWDSSKENIVIFNSSEDEFFAIGGDCGVKALYKNQLIGIKEILNKYQFDRSKHFTLRVHPHLKGLPYSYHQELYKLSFGNLTVVPAESDISTYSLVDAADKVIVFGSTMGVESTYWGKPTINLAYAMYNLLDVVYIPKDINELWALIDNKNLIPKSKNNALLYGYYFMTTKRDGFRYVNVSKREKLCFCGLHINTFSEYKLLGSSLLYGLWRKIMQEVYIPCIWRYRSVPT